MPGYNSKPRFQSYFKAALMAVFLVLILVFSGCGSKDNSETQLSGTQTVQAPINKKVSVAQAKTIIEQNSGHRNFIILDVRTADEFAVEHLANAVNLDVQKPEFKTMISGLVREYVYLVYCRTGVRSAEAARIMKGLDFLEVYHLSGGITQWKQDGNATVQ
jgi:rhodanese-related sulfurtransferase